MKERQRWQPEEDALLRAYVKQYGPKEWHLVSDRMGRRLDRDAKSCLERWKNYLKPGIKKGSLTPEEQSLVISLQAKYGNKWKKIAAEIPGRTAKRLGKWWEVFKEKQLKEQQRRSRHASADFSSADSGLSVADSSGRYDHILETFAEKYVRKAAHMAATDPRLTLGAGIEPVPQPPAPVLPPWMANPPAPLAPPTSPSVSLSLSPSSAVEPPTGVTGGTAASAASAVHSSAEMLLSRGWVHGNKEVNGITTLVVQHQLPAFMQYCKDLEEGRQAWFQHKKEATWRLSRLEQQLESEKARKRREKMEEVEGKIRVLREEEMAYLDKLESECREQLSGIQRDAEMKEAKLMEQWVAKHVKVTKMLEQMGGSAASAGYHHFPCGAAAPGPKDLH
ncbi:transcription factor AS1-like [Nymphaea colorata]|uniref:Uncharacterized protein n=1 Tax=Nymphaea colorata TaxID=210225 RepID=A0A5K0Y1J3_9MAGN|nr:transcription factor AS1-like [Nymphaea colorata]